MALFLVFGSRLGEIIGENNWGSIWLIGFGLIYT